MLAIQALLSNTSAVAPKETRTPVRGYAQSSDSERNRQACLFRSRNLQLPNYRQRQEQNRYNTDGAGHPRHEVERVRINAAAAR